MNWKPIETAPKDGTRILLFIPEGNKVEVGAPDNPNEEFIEWAVDSSDYIIEPSHWMSLPDPPVA